MTWKNTLLNSKNMVMHLESKFRMSLVFVTTFFVVVLLLFFLLGGGGGGGVLRQLVAQTNFEFKISGPLVTSLSKVDFNDNYSFIQQNFTCHMESARKRKMHVELESLHLQHLLSHNSLAECFTKKKNKQNFHDHAAYDYSREYKSRWSVTTI